MPVEPSPDPVATPPSTSSANQPTPTPLTELEELELDAKTTGTVEQEKLQKIDGNLPAQADSTKPIIANEIQSLDPVPSPSTPGPELDLSESETAQITDGNTKDSPQTESINPVPESEFPQPSEETGPAPTPEPQKI
jgi:hypothetical protein